MNRNVLLVAALAVTAMVVFGLNAQAQVSFNSFELLPDGSNLVAPVGVPQHSGITLQYDDAGGNGDGTGQTGEFGAGEFISFNDIEFVLAPEQIVISAGGALFGRNNNPDENGGVGDLTFQFTGSESFNVDPLGLPTITEDAYYDVDGDGEEDDLHSGLEGIVFSGPKFTVNNLTPSEDYLVQFVSWDAGVENEGGAVLNREQRVTAVDSNGSTSFDFNQFVADGPDAFANVGDSSDEIRAAVVTAEFTADALGSIMFSLDPINGNDNGILNAVFVFGDNSLVPIVPEPAAAVLAAMGLVSLGIVRKRK